MQTSCLRALPHINMQRKPPPSPLNPLNPEPNESKVKRGFEEMNPHFFKAPLCFVYKGNLFNK